MLGGVYSCWEGLLLLGGSAVAGRDLLLLGCLLLLAAGNLFYCLPLANSIQIT